MVLLIGVGLLAGLATALSPCVLPVLPLVLAGGATGRKPLQIVAGLVVSFSAFLLFATWLLDKLGLPQDFLRNLAIVLLFLMAAVLLLPPVAQLLERGLAVFSRMRPAKAGGGFFLGMTLGLVFVPCAGPFLASITAAAAHESFGLRTIVAAVAYGVGAGVPMLAIALGGREIAGHIRRNAAAVRTASGVIVVVVAVALVFHADDRLTTLTLPWTNWVQTHVERSSAAQKQERKVSGEGAAIKAIPSQAKGGLPDLGVAPPLHAGGDWINSKPFTLPQKRGKVVLVDFWTYSCINCLRTLPHLKAWYAAYHRKGFEIVGVHTPEFAFEHVASNVRAAVKRLGLTWPVVQDNNFKTWDNYSNEYWPADYLIDKQGHIRFTSFGEGDYGKTESTIRQLLGAKGPAAANVANTTPTEALTPETYLGYERIQNFAGSRLYPNHFHTYTFPHALAESAIAYSGMWKLGAQEVEPGAGAALRIHFHAKDVYIVLGGKGTVQKLVDGKPAGTFNVGAYRLYTVVASRTLKDATLELRFSPGVRGYSFTFG
ncbi:MAG TPA: cytochrome c biogenesis protein DipZ [Gaiellaceae bacterium]|nr:cytochrome c biogenesis protein DipZ [Gaiellaceae bacterium]